MHQSFLIIFITYYKGKSSSEHFWRHDFYGYRMSPEIIFIESIIYIYIIKHVMLLETFISCNEQIMLCMYFAPLPLEYGSYQTVDRIYEVNALEFLWREEMCLRCCRMNHTWSSVYVDVIICYYFWCIVVMGTTVIVLKICVL